MTVAASRFANLDGVAESATLAMTRRAAALALAGGPPVISLSAGEPDFATPRYIADAGVRAIREGRTHYPPAAGISELRTAIATDLEACGGAYGADQILVSVGAKGALFATIFTLFGPGDRVVVPAPYWVSYPEMVRLARAEPVIVETGPDDGFKLTAARLEPVLDDRVRGVILNSPSNPTGAIHTAAELDALVQLAAANEVWILADEIYHAVRYIDAFASMAARAGDGARVVVLGGFSKAYAMTGWRVGYAAGPEEAIRAMTRLQGHVNTNTAVPSQWAAVAAIVEADSRDRALAEMVGTFRSRRDLLLDGLAGIPGLRVHPPDGAFYLWIDVGAWCDALGGGSMDLCLDLLEKERLALVPGSAFGAEGYVRLSFAASDDVLRTAVERLEAAGHRLTSG